VAHVLLARPADALGIPQISSGASSRKVKQSKFIAFIINGL
jgi:hypothetical protein